MIGEAPNYSWDKYARQVGETKPCDKKAKERGDSGYSLIALSTETPDEIKMEFERFPKSILMDLLNSLFRTCKIRITHGKGKSLNGPPLQEENCRWQIRSRISCACLME